jgi:hypothetical protein
MTDHDVLPSLALSVRQPWAWAIVSGWKDIENRSAAMIRHLSPLKGRRAIHAAKGMTQEEYRAAREFMASIDVECPPPGELLRGGIVGSVDIVDVVKTSGSRWFVGSRGLVLRNARPCSFVPAVGALGYFHWQPANPGIVPPPARWMRPMTRDASIDADDGLSLFGPAP